MLSGHFIYTESVFWFCALGGTGMLVIQLVMALMGTDHDDAIGFEDAKFQWMTKQGVTGFLMMFGWVGLTCHLQLMLGTLSTLLISVGAGALSAFISALIFHVAKKAHSSGSVFKMGDAIGKEAMVYQRIPLNGSGKISIVMNELTYEVDAISAGQEIPSFTSVQIIKQADDNTLVVIPLK
jgi:hypothetical protein